MRRLSILPRFPKKSGFCRAVAGIALLSVLHGCYYMQAVRGQMDVMRKRESIADVIDADETPPELAARLRLVDEARQFSIDELGLPDNDSYRSYANVERDYVVWNVFAAPEFSLQAKHWCFPVAGCVNYRGYFSEQAARREASKLERKGLDVIVGGVSAYSTLGRFSDPVLNTMMRWDDVQLVATLFHELAHQVLYIKGDTGFNESFATAVEEVGIRRWLLSRGNEHNFTAYRERRELRQRLMQIFDTARADLKSYYSMSVDDDDKRSLKERRFEQLSNEVADEFRLFGRDASRWLGVGLNNARLASMSLYDGHVPAFRALLRDCNDELACFFDEARRLSKLDRNERNSQLDVLATTQELVQKQG